ncbi:hypothetical protein AHAS_Ahas20G0180100 [Arachis hypogaea]
MAFPGANESMSGALYLQKGEDIQSERHSSKQKENESIDVCVDDKVINYLNGRDVQQKVLVISAQKGKGMQFQRSGILTTLCDHSFQCPCVSKWTYLSCPAILLSQNVTFRKEAAYYMPSTSRHI